MGKGRFHLIMPMAGGGVRFASGGIDMPKPLIMLGDEPFFYKAVRSVEKYIEPMDITFVVLADHVERFSIDRRIREYYPDAAIRVIPRVLDGAVLTCLEGVKEIEDDAPLLFNDCDHAFICREFYEAMAGGGIEEDRALLTFGSSDPAFSYVRFDEAGRAVGTVEKQVVSDRAICGAYYFSGRKLFEELARDYLDKCSYSEYFMSGLYNVGERGGIRIFSLDEHISFGTPAEYEKAMEYYASK